MTFNSTNEAKCNLRKTLILTLHGHRFRLSGIPRAMLPENTLLFCTADDGGDVEFCFEYHFTDYLPLESPAAEGWHTIYQKANIKIWRKGQLERRQLLTSDATVTYAIYEETDSRHAVICFAKPYSPDLSTDTIFVSTLSLERHLAPCGSYILHCAYMSHHGEAILLSGPSGTGKSTHATLWEHAVADTHVVNGDRCLITQEADGTYSASGWPVCGSSAICHAESHPLRAIVFIEQTPGNQIIAKPVSRLFVRLFSQLTVNHWDTGATAAAADWAEELMRRIPVMVYGCNMDADAPLPLLTHIRSITGEATSSHPPKDIPSWH